MSSTAAQRPSVCRSVGLLYLFCPLCLVRVLARLVNRMCSSPRRRKSGTRTAARRFPPSGTRVSREASRVRTRDRALLTSLAAFMRTIPSFTGTLTSRAFPSAPPAFTMTCTHSRFLHVTLVSAYDHVRGICYALVSSRSVDWSPGAVPVGLQQSRPA